jgi:hypothetical protein
MPENAFGRKFNEISGLGFVLGETEGNYTNW